MFPIRGMISKKDYHAPWVAYLKDEEEGHEIFRPMAAFEPYSPPDPNVISSILL